MQSLKLLSSASNWYQLNKKLEELTKSGQTKLAGSAFELLVKYYLLTNPIYQSKLKNVWLLDEVKEGIKKKLIINLLKSGDLIWRLTILLCMNQ
jgi:predicted helicase